MPKKAEPIHKSQTSQHPKISLIAAMSENEIIGVNNQLPWHIPADLKRFKQLTLNKPVIMGRKTFASIGKPLPDRENIIISRNPYFAAKACKVVASLAAALELVKDAKEVMVIGGAQIYAEALPLADCLYLTIVHTKVQGDTYFPRFNKDDWREVERQDFAPDAKDPYGYSFVTLIRKKPKS